MPVARFVERPSASRRPREIRAVAQVSDLVGDNFDVPPGMPGKPPRCWSAFGERWAAENGFKHVKRQGGPSGECKMIYPYLWLQRTC